ncbi:MAG TPA: GNAT family N-acetyltransferase [Actinomycetota bacterium]|nr:GNAT family N-acetyltransferase [Actinomycetota bacterium]
MSVRIRRARTDELTPDELDALHRLCRTAFADPGATRDPADLGFTAEDWAHACGGVHAFAVEDGVPTAHGSVVERELHVAGVALHAGYVEAVATRSDHRGRGLGTAVMRALGVEIRARFELGALDTSLHGFYARLGWEPWRGPTFVRTDDGLVATTEEDGYVMILRTPSTPRIDLDAPISCEWRPGDVW